MYRKEHIDPQYLIPNKQKILAGTKHIDKPAEEVLELRDHGKNLTETAHGRGTPSHSIAPVRRFEEAQGDFQVLESLLMRS